MAILLGISVIHMMIQVNINPLVPVGYSRSQSIDNQLQQIQKLYVSQSSDETFHQHQQKHLLQLFQFVEKLIEELTF